MYPFLVTPPQPAQPEKIHAESFFRQWGIIHGCATPADIPESLAGKVAMSCDMFRCGKQRLLEEILCPDTSEKLIDALRLRIHTLLSHATRLPELPPCIGQAEQRTAEMMQSVTSTYEYSRHQPFPMMMIRSRTMNCLGASILMSACLRRQRIRHLQCEVYEHALLLLCTSDDRILWLDPLAPFWNQEISAEDIEEPATLADVITFGRQPDARGLSFRLRPERYRNKVPAWQKHPELPTAVTVFDPDTGQHAMLLDSTAHALIELKKFPEAAEACSIAIAEAPSYTGSYQRLGEALRALGRHREAQEAYRMAAELTQGSS